MNRFLKIEPYLHILFWVSYLLLPYIKSIRRLSGSYNLLNEIVDLAFGLLAFYLTYFMLEKATSRLKGLFIWCLVIIAACYLNFTVHNHLFGGTHILGFGNYFLSYFSTYLILAAFAYALFSIKLSHRKQAALELSHKERNKAEMAALKAQINPHFLFNTLNTIYMNSLRKDDKTPELILRLSKGFKYLLQEGQNEQVEIQKEIDHLVDFIELQKERLTKKVVVDFTLDVDDKKQKIAPLLLIAFVENSFKYSSQLRGANNPIVIKLKLYKGVLDFYCGNKFDPSVQVESGLDYAKSTGIGIENTKKRLNLAYPDKHALSTSSKEGCFKVKLKIELV